MTGYPFEDPYNSRVIDDMVTAVRKKYGAQKPMSAKASLKSGPTVFYGEFTLTESDIADTYFDPSGWGKGVVFINGFNLGRYWPLVGPQITLYVPKDLLRVGTNKIALLELQQAPEDCQISFTDTPNLDGLSI